MNPNLLIDPLVRTVGPCMLTADSESSSCPDVVTVIMIDPEQRLTAVGLRQRIDEAIRVTRRVYLGGGLRHRMAA